MSLSGAVSLFNRISQRQSQTAASQLPQHLYNALKMLKHAPVDLIQVPGAGRGLAASQCLPQGTIIHTEQPMLCFPAMVHIGKVCHHCLKPLQQPSHVSAQGTFCSSACKQTAASAYHTVESALDLEPLQKYCRHFEERFPLLVTRAACMHLTQALRSPLQQQKLPAAEPPQGLQVPHLCSHSAPCATAMG